MIAAMKPKGMKGGMKSDNEEKDSEKDSEDEGKSEDEYAGLAFDALKDDDKDAFVEAFKGAVRACVEKDDAGEYDEEE